MFRPPRNPPLFPYPTLFRSENRFIPTASVYYSFPAVLAFAALGPAWDFARASRRWIGRLLLAGFLAVFATHILLGANLLAFGGDRKSTRLNSSHLVISYAVF